MSAANPGPLMTTYQPSSLAFESGEGIWLYDQEGNKYLDLVSGIAVCNLGHCHPAVTRAIREQAGRLVHTSNLYRIPQQEQLAAQLCRMAGMENCFFSNSGAEANEAAIKLARLHGSRKGIDNPTIIVMEQAFHGRTLATLSATGSRKVQAGFEPLVKGFVRAPYNDVEAVRKIGENNPEVVAVLVEPIQGEGGVQIPASDYLSRLREVCDDQNWLLMLDEVQTGVGRTGEFFCYQHENIQPDVITSAKALGNGFPIGACLARGEAAHTFQPGSHGSTFGGNPLACATASTVLETLETDNLIQNARTVGRRLLEGFKDRLEGAPHIQCIRGKGLMIGIELDHPCPELIALARAKGLLINVAAEKTIRLLPPLVLSEQEADLVVDTLSKLIKVYIGDDRAKPRR